MNERVSRSGRWLRSGNRIVVLRMLNTWVARSRRSVAPLKEDGLFGPLTEGRVIAFRRPSGLLVDRAASCSRRPIA